MTTSLILMAMDRAPESVRSLDANGYLHVEVSNISKANVCPYYGREIPADGLEPDRLYYLYRDPEELARAADTFNNVPLLSEHVAVIPTEGLPESLIIGSTGTDAEFDGTYLRNSLVVWHQAEQDAIASDRKRELSCGYRYRADMTPGTTPDGLSYDGVMRDIIGNHVALVIQGRAGPDVVIGDECMSKLNSRTALMVTGAVTAMIRPRLAADAKVDITKAMKGVDAKSLAMDGAPEKLAEKLEKAVKPHLAADKAISAEELAGAIDAIRILAADEDKIDAEDEDEVDGEDEELEVGKAPSAEDEDGDEDEGDKPKGMDAATVAQMIAKAEARGRRAAVALDTARADVRPLVGEITGMDSAEALYRYALKDRGYDKVALDSAPLATLQGMVKREVAASRPAPRIAKDSAPSGQAAKLGFTTGKLLNI